MYPEVVLLPSPGLTAVISIPPLERFFNVNDASVPLLSTDKTIVLKAELEPTISVEFTIVPLIKVIFAAPIVSPTLILSKSNAPSSEEKTELSISVSPASWLTFIFRSDN